MCEDGERRSVKMEGEGCVKMREEEYEDGGRRMCEDGERRSVKMEGGGV